VLLVALPLALLVVAITTALRPLHRAELPAWRKRLADFVPFAVLLVLCFVPDLLANEAISADDLPARVLRAQPCLIVGTIAASVAFSVVRVLDRTTRGSGLAAIGAACLASMIALEAFCPATSSVHLCAGHFGAAIVFSAAALGLRAWGRAWQSRVRA
jgi:branched-subunit amino acid transport protein